MEIESFKLEKTSLEKHSRFYAQLVVAFVAESILVAVGHHIGIMTPAGIAFAAVNGVVVAGSIPFIAKQALQLREETNSEDAPLLEMESRVRQRASEKPTSR